MKILNLNRMVLGFLAAMTTLISAPAFAAYTGAIWTSTENPVVNENQYANKCAVYLNGGPGGLGNNQLKAGLYYWEVQEPNGVRRLSFSPASTRAITVTLDSEGNGNFGGVQLGQCNPDATYATTTNSGGEYKVVLIKAFGGDCSGTSIAEDGVVINFEAKCTKSDNFKVVSEDGGGGCTGEECGCTGEGCGTVTPTAPQVFVQKDAVGSYDKLWTWSIAKSYAGPSRITQSSGSASVSYSVLVTRDGGVASNTQVSGTIVVSVIPGNTATNVPIPATNISLVDTLLDANDETDSSVPCTVSMPNIASLSGSQNVPYSCVSLLSGPASDIAANFVEATSTNAGSDSWYQPFLYTVNKTNECANVSDTAPEFTSAGTICGSASYDYIRTLAVPNGCVDYPNLASIALSTTGTQDSSATIRVCGLFNSGAHTIGFWQNKNGQAILKGSTPTAPNCPVAAFLDDYAPFTVPSVPGNGGLTITAASTCNQVANYVNSVIKAASASGAAMNAMLKAQMLSTALSVFFHSEIQAPGPIGGLDIDLTNVAGMNTSSAFNCPTVVAHDTVLNLLSCAASKVGVGGANSAWYLQDKAMQERAKNTFDMINNRRVYLW